MLEQVYDLVVKVVRPGHADIVLGHVGGELLPAMSEKYRPARVGIAARPLIAPLERLSVL